VLERVKGRAEVKHRHGDVALAEIGGALTLEARHGKVTVRGVAGAATLDTQHGDVKVEGSAGLRVKQPTAPRCERRRRPRRGSRPQRGRRAERPAVISPPPTSCGGGGRAINSAETGRHGCRQGALTAEARFGMTLRHAGPWKCGQHGGVCSRSAQAEDCQGDEVIWPTSRRGRGTQRGEVTCQGRDPGPGEHETRQCYSPRRPGGPADSCGATATWRSVPGPEVTRDAPGTTRCGRAGGGGTVRLRTEGGEIQ
jgi:hypothetical protein